MSYAVEKLENWQLAYIAGIVDGEGCLNLSTQTNRGDVSPQFSVGMTNMKCVLVLHNMTGIGNFYIRQMPKGNKTQYKWITRGRLEIYLLLRAIYPYLIVKKEHADIMIEFVERRIQGKPFDARDTELLTEMHRLNK